MTTDPATKKAIRFITQNHHLLNVTKIGELSLPKGSAEAVRCNEIKDILEGYSARPKVSCPLSIAVFGPPGSGKSHFVREIVASLKNSGAPFFVNLSQLSDPKDLAEAFEKELNRRTLDSTSIFFFDEFDAPLGKVSLGWLRWFLAPMQDGEFFFDGKSIKIGKAVFMFAGGTASSRDEFEKKAQADPAGYHDKKVPDFISRLRGFVDIQGINNLDSERAVRRAIVLHHLLEKRWPGLRARKKGRFPIDKKLVDSLLSNVHFVHGARSMEALLDMCRLRGKGAKVHLPGYDLRELHLSRGLLDGKTIGISAGQSDPKASRLLSGLTDTLLRNGATLAYGGDFITEGTTLDRLVKAAKLVPDELLQRKDKRIRNYLGFPSFLNHTVVKQHLKEAKYVEFIKLKTLSRSELKNLDVPRKQWFAARPLGSEPYNLKHHLAWALSLFRMRVRLIHDIHALIVVGGKDGKSWGRFSGIAEEVMLAMALGKPVYVLGGRGGAAYAVGRLLGLGATLANPNTCLVAKGSIDPVAVPENYANCFNIPGKKLPFTIPEIRRFLLNRAVTTPAWPWNGLRPEENRELFCTRIAGSKGGDCVDLIMRGLSRLDWKLPSVSPR